MLVHQRLPRQKFVDRESVTAAGFLKRQQSTTHGKNHLSLTANDPALRARVRQIGNCQWAAIRPRQRGRRRPSQQSIWWAARHADLHSPALRSPSRKRERSAGSAYTVFVSTWSIDKSGCSVSVWASAAFASSILPSSAKDTAHQPPGSGVIWMQCGGRTTYVDGLLTAGSTTLITSLRKSPHGYDSATPPALASNGCSQPTRPATKWAAHTPKPPTSHNHRDEVLVPRITGARNGP